MSKKLLPSKAKACQRYACDNVPRFRVKGSDGLHAYGQAYHEIFAQSFGVFDGDKLIHTRESIRRLTALNQMYLGLPSVRAFLQEDYTRRVIENERAKEAAERPESPQITPSA